MTDEETVNGIINKNQNAFEALVDKYGGIVKSVVYKHLYLLPSYCDDCINEVLFDIWRNIDRYDPEKNSLKNWIGAVSRYKAIDFKRKYLRRIADVTLDKADKLLADRIESDMKCDVEDLLKCLTDEDREIFYRHYIFGEKVPEMSVRNGKTQSFYFNRLSRGRSKISEAYFGKKEYRNEK